MKSIEIYGTGCQKCEQLYENAKIAISELGLTCDIKKVTDITKIVSAGIVLTPAVAVDGNIQFSGKVPAVEELKILLQEECKS
ncbi:MTH895/ArsE family thioredoxin-like protein [Lentisphaerota bacterium ZTH]|nr:TM0996/MTH895 family glutaredoxin-like protein [Lentisphaerota bacterium]WET06688.1 MTH895/ArsE family thioredoxin-like protein [Lentisphaerota bacterium ZTH]